MEKWKQIKDFEYLYMVSNHGNVKSLDRVVNHSRYGKQKKKGRLLNIKKPTNNGYLRCALAKENIVYRKLMHVLVAVAFIPNPEKKTQVNHINGIKTDNRVENLEWCTNRENVSHYWSNKEKSSKYVGVSFNKNAKKWIANIRINGKQKYLGLFKTEKQAHNKYKQELNKYNNGK